MSYPQDFTIVWPAELAELNLPTKTSIALRCQKLDPSSGMGLMAAVVDHITNLYGYEPTAVMLDISKLESHSVGISEYVAEGLLTQEEADQYEAALHPPPGPS